MVFGQPVVSGSDAAELLELSDAALDHVAPLVFFRIEVSGSVHLRALRDDRPGADRFDMVEYRVGILGLVGDDMSWSEAGDQRQRMARVARLATGEDQA